MLGDISTPEAINCKDFMRAIIAALSPALL